MTTEIQQIALFELILNKKFKGKDISYDIRKDFRPETLSDEIILTINPERLIEIALKCFEEAIEENNMHDDTVKGFESKVQMPDTLRVIVPELDKRYRQSYVTKQMPNGMEVVDGN